MAGFFEWLFGKKKERTIRDSRPVWTREHNQVLDRILEDTREREEWKKSRLKDAGSEDRWQLPMN